MVTIRIRSMAWFATGAVLALIVSLMVMDAWRADAAPGDSDTTFVSLTSCRLIDTRPPPDRVGTNGSWGIKDTKTLQATGTNGDCTIPAEAVGLSLKVFALNATAGGFLTIWGEGALPLGSALNPSPSGIVFSAVTTDLSATGSFKVYNENGTVDVIIDVNGYYTKTSLKEIDARLRALENSPAAGVNFNGGDQFLALDNSAQSVRSVVLEAPGAGHVVVTASGYTDFGSAAFDSGRCALTDGAVSFADDGHDISFDDFGITASSEFKAFSATRTFAVPAGSTTFHLVCREVVGTVTFSDSQITALYVKDRLAP